MNEHNNNDGQMEETMTDAKNPWNADLNDPYLGLKLASERLSIVRYVFLVQIEDGIACGGTACFTRIRRRGC